MARRDKRLPRIRNNSRQVRLAELRTVLEGAGFVGRPGKGDHWVFTHDAVAHPVVIDPRRPLVLPVYVRAALAAIDALAQQEEDDDEPTDN